MNLIELYPEIVKALGWTLIHSLWQGLILFIVLAVLLHLLRNHTPQVRYHLSLITLLFFVAWMALTFTRHFPDLSQTAMATAIDFDNISEGISVLQSPPLPKKEELSAGRLTPSVQQAGLQFGLFVDRFSTQLVFLWFTGMLLFTFRWLGSIYYTYRLRKIKTNPLPKEWQQKLGQLAIKLGIKRRIRLLESAKIEVPLVIGHLKPVILIPVGMLSGLTPQQVESVFIHELAHIQRNDFLINMVLSGLEVLLFYHPAFWYMTRQIRQEREKCCDDVAVAALGNAKSYARTLLIMEEKRQQRSLAMALQGDKDQLFNRIKRICLVPQHNHKWDMAKAVCSLALILIMGMMAWAEAPSNKAVKIINALPDLSESTPIEKKLTTELPKTTRSEFVPTSPSFNSNELPSQALSIPDAALPVPEESLAGIQKTKEVSERMAIESFSPLENTQEVFLKTSDLTRAFPNFRKGKSKIRIDTVPIPPLPDLNPPEMAPFPEFKVTTEELMAEFEATGTLVNKINPYKVEVLNWESNYLTQFHAHWTGRQKEILAIYEKWKKDLKQKSKSEIAYAIAMQQSKAFEKALKAQEHEMKKQEPGIRKYVEDSFKALEESIKKIENEQEDRDKRMGIHSMRMNIHSMRMNAHSTRMDMHSARMNVHSARMNLHSDRMNEHSIIMDALKKELFAELEKDGLLKKDAKSLNFTIKNDVVKVNGKKLSDPQAKKYIQLIQSYGINASTDGDSEWHFRIKNNSTSIGTHHTTKEE